PTSDPRSVATGSSSIASPVAESTPTLSQTAFSTGANSKPSSRAAWVSPRRSTADDPRGEKDEMVLEAAVAGGCSAIITYNKRDFAGAERFNLTISSPQEFLKVIGALP